MSKVDEKLNDTFEVELVEDPLPIESSDDSDDRKEDTQTDYVQSRDNFYELVEKGKEALDGAMDIARETDQPRAYEVVAQLLKNVTDTNKEIIELQKRMEDLKAHERKLGNTNINNALFVGSTADLQKMLQDNK
jgi:hypothetical protein